VSFMKIGLLKVLVDLRLQINPPHRNYVFCVFYYYVLKNSMTVRASKFADLSSQNHDFKSSLETSERLTNLQLLFFKKL
jgi:hypothetical protein